MPQGKGNREHCLGNTVTGRINPVSDHASRFNYWFAEYGQEEHVNTTRMQLACFRMSPETVLPDSVEILPPKVIIEEDGDVIEEEIDVETEEIIEEEIIEEVEDLEELEEVVEEESTEEVEEDDS